MNNFEDDMLNGHDFGGFDGTIEDKRVIEELFLATPALNEEELAVMDGVALGEDHGIRFTEMASSLDIKEINDNRPNEPVSQDEHEIGVVLIPENQNATVKAKSEPLPAGASPQRDEALENQVQGHFSLKNPMGPSSKNSTALPAPVEACMQQAVPLSHKYSDSFLQDIQHSPLNSPFPSFNPAANPGQSSNAMAMGKYSPVPVLEDGMSMKLHGVPDMQEQLSAVDDSDQVEVAAVGSAKRSHPGPDTSIPKKRTRTKVDDLDPSMVHVCTYPGCNKKFAKKYNLKIHERRHRGDLPFICDYNSCGKKFMWLSSFQRHQRVHLARQDGDSRRARKRRLGGETEADEEPRSPDVAPAQGELSFKDGGCTVNVNGIPVPVDVTSRSSVEIALCFCSLADVRCDGLWDLYEGEDSKAKRMPVANQRVEQVKRIRAAPFQIDNPYVRKLCRMLEETK